MTEKELFQGRWPAGQGLDALRERSSAEGALSPAAARCPASAGRRRRAATTRQRREGADGRAVLRSPGGLSPGKLPKVASLRWYDSST